MHTSQANFSYFYLSMPRKSSLNFKKMKKIYSLFFLLFFQNSLSAQTIPAFGKEISVKINGLTFDAMEPSISADGNFLFFNSLNDGISTSLYYATRLNDSTFNFAGLLKGASGTSSPRMDAVTSSDVSNNFYWMSLRNFPQQYDNFFHGKFNGVDVVNIGRLHGTFYIYQAGWLIMDAAINYTGDLLYYCNAYFNTDYKGCNGIPCQAKLGIAQKVNDSTYNKISNSDALLKILNDTNYIVYAPFISKNGLELYFTRGLHHGTQPEICVAVRNTTLEAFGMPTILYTSSAIPEAPTLSTDGSRMYYHKNEGGIFKVFLRFRNNLNGLNEKTYCQNFKITPNPVQHFLNIELPYPEHNCIITIYSTMGQLLLKASENHPMDTSSLADGLYTVSVYQNGQYWTSHFIKEP
jgi:hypothetical protein